MLRDGLELALSGVEADQRGAFVDALRPLAEQGVDVFAGLVVALDSSDQLLGAVWLQPQVGRTGTLWPPALLNPADTNISRKLMQHALDCAPQLSIILAQALLPNASDPISGDLLALGFAHLAELQYLLLRVSPKSTPFSDSPLTLKPSATADFNLFKRLLLGTYESTLDCPALAGLRDVEDIVSGYQAVGEHDDSLWFVVEWQHQPAGLLLLSAYPEHTQWELVYMGVLPEFRGRGIGDRVLAELHHRAQQAGVDSVVLAVDAANAPAVNMYARAGYVEWSRRSAYIKPLSQCNKTA